MINWLAYTKIPPGSPPLEAWDTAADQQACVDQYKGWTYPWLDLHGLFAATPAERGAATAERRPRSDPALELRRASR